MRPGNGSGECQCFDGVQNGGELGVDCDGPCASCALSCLNGVQNGLETDVDCGGDACGPCDVGDDCDSDADCAGENCDGGTCS